MTSLLPPREIQSRIRAGETPEHVATAAQTTVEKVLVYAGPVLAERAHIAGLAQAASVRSPGGATGTLESLVHDRLVADSIDPRGVEWDAWKRPDTRWQVVADVALDGETRRATFVHDVAGRYVTAEDDLARWLVGEIAVRPGRRAPTPSAADAAPEASGSGSGRDAEIPLPPAPAEQTLRSVRDGDLDDAPPAPVSGVDAPAELSADGGEEPVEEQLSLGDDAIALVTGSPATRPATGRAADWRSDDAPAGWLGGDARPGRTPPPAPVETTAADDDGSPAEPSTEAPAEAPSETSAQDVLFGEPEPAEDAAGKPGRKRGRASIPSWDEIMFGGPSDGAPLASGEDPGQRDDRDDRTDRDED